MLFLCVSCILVLVFYWIALFVGSMLTLGSMLYCRRTLYIKPFTFACCLNWFACNLRTVKSLPLYTQNTQAV